MLKRSLAPWLLLLGSSLLTLRPATFTVDNTLDQVPANPTDRVEGSFRQAILDANANPGADTITFNISGLARIVYTDAARFPEITDPVIIQGFNEANGQRIELVGTNAPINEPAALVINAGHSTIRGLVISGFATGILLQTNGFNLIEGNFIGTDLSGAVAQTNRGHGIWIQSPSNTVGGLTAEARNVLAGNGGNGVRIERRTAIGNRVLGNFIGTDVSGTIALGNGQDGVLILSVPSNVIGGTEAGAGNLISGNGENGIYIAGPLSTNNLIQGNLIGTDLSGTLSLSNAIAGISFVLGASANVVGGATVGARNVISGNGEDGVDLGSGTFLNLVQGNFIGTDVTGTNQLGNSFDGVYLVDGAFNNLIGEPGVGNIIAFNESHGIFDQSSGSGNTFSENLILSNDSLGIDLDEEDELDESGVTENDTGDEDAGPNDFQNFPELAAASSSGGQVVIEGAFNSKPNATYRLEFFSIQTCDPSEHGEGGTFLGASAVKTDGTGTASFNITLFKGAADGVAITATATDSSGNTSEFSNCVLVEETVAILLSIRRSQADFVIAWPVSAEGFELEETDNLAAPAQWTKVAVAPTVVGDENTVIISPASGSEFFRLRKP